MVSLNFQATCLLLCLFSHKMNDESASPKKFTLRILESPVIIGIDLGANVIDNPGILY